MKKIIHLLFTIILATSFVLAACSSPVNVNEKSQKKETRKKDKASTNTNTTEEDEELVLDSASIPLTLEAIEDGTIILTGYAVNDRPNHLRTVYFQKDDGIIDYAGNNIIVKAGDQIHFYGKNFNGGVKIQCTADCYVYGNVMSLQEYTDFKDKKVINYQNEFDSLFISNTHIKNHETLKIVLPATTLTQSCYSKMFQGCTNLTVPPELPATTLAYQCYYYMFNNCTNLTVAPELPATTLAYECYYHMFENCTSLEIAPVLPATSMPNDSYCYQCMFTGCTSLTTVPEIKMETITRAGVTSMFQGCSSLNYVKCLTTRNTATNATYYWLANVSSTGTFVKAASMDDWTRDASGIPAGWNVVDAQ